MFARLTTFENRDTPRLDELLRLLGSREQAEREVPGALAQYLLADRAEGRVLGLTLFESKEVMKAAEPAFERIGREIITEMHGRRTSVGFFDVVLHDVVEGAMACRMTTFRGDPTDRTGGLREKADAMFAETRARDGNCGTIVLVDHAAGIGKSFVLWESLEALRVSEEFAADLRRRAIGIAGEKILSVQRFEIPFSFDRAPDLPLM